MSADDDEERDDAEAPQKERYLPSASERRQIFDLAYESGRTLAQAERVWLARAGLDDEEEESQRLRRPSPREREEARSETLARVHANGGSLSEYAAALHKVNADDDESTQAPLKTWSRSCRGHDKSSPRGDDHERPDLQEWIKRVHSRKW